MDRHMNWTAWCIVLLFWLALGFSTSSAASQADRTAQTDQATQAAQQVPASAIITKSTTAIGYAVGGPTTKST